MPSPQFPQVAMETEEPIIGSYVFHGIEYIVSLSSREDQLIVEVEEKDSADQWRETYDAPYIEELTHKTGNFKQFRVFVSMLASAVLQTSETVSLDLLTYQDLEILRSKKSGGGGRGTSAANGLNSKRYLILTYTVEFDRIHYPLPLPYVGKPDPRILQDMIRDLRDEIADLKRNGNGRHSNSKLQRQYDHLLAEKEDLEVAFQEYRMETEAAQEGSSVNEGRMLKKMIRSLEEDLMKERSKNQRINNKRSQEYRQLMDELEDVKASERNLKARVKSLTNELAVFRRQGSRALPNSSRVSSHRNTTSSSLRNRSGMSSHDNSRRSSSRENSFCSQRSQKSRKNNSYLSGGSRDSSIERSWRSNGMHTRNRSTSRERAHSRERPSNTRSRTPSPAGSLRKGRFDPTAYTREKQRKRKEAEMKLRRDRKPGRPSSLDRKPPLRQSYPRAQPPSRTSSVGSLRSVASSIESLSDIPVASDTSINNGPPVRNAPQYQKVNEWSNGNKKHAKQLLSSTPDAPTRTKSRLQSQAPQRSKENLQNSELADIDARLSRLQDFMKENLALT
ncbi:hypothetical protein CAPTEDRAFT_226826 [Capitella teleta]|uniref:Centrosomal protein CCDC61 n=1 Tax=Capitella teleta TaxID=283909 RepID=R7VF78_CAPTE|nr:hypothetical protein CAPTEDRAFT_226826 [Capitella teleta]|eukprot:ELU17212.1 hypothetical protein CAPTEDRAFT_226826 [Capitella teleta]